MFMVKTSQFTTKQKSKLLNYNHKTHVLGFRFKLEMRGKA